MKKFILPALLLILGLFVFAGCGSDQADSPLVGEWVWEFDSEWIYVFRADGTGTRGGGEFQPELENFTWSERSRGTVVRMDMTSGPLANERHEWTFTISGNVLTMESTIETFRYIRR